MESKQKAVDHENIGFLDRKMREMHLSIEQDCEVLVKEGFEKSIGGLTSLGMFLVALFLGYGPSYIQADIPWFSIGTAILCLVFLLGGIITFFHTYPQLCTFDIIFSLFSIPASIVFYTTPQPQDVPIFRVMSFGFLLMVLLLIHLRIPTIVLACRRWKGKGRTAVFSKKNVALLIGVFSAGTAICGSLLQLIPAISQLFH